MDPINSAISNEIAIYITLNRCENPLDFWRTSKLQILKKTARYIYAIPASSAGSERRFSIAGKCQTIDRASLKPQKLCQQVKIANFVRNK